MGNPSLPITEQVLVGIICFSILSLFYLWGRSIKELLPYSQVVQWIIIFLISILIGIIAYITNGIIASDKIASSIISISIFSYGVIRQLLKSTK